MKTIKVKLKKLVNDVAGLALFYAVIFFGTIAILERIS